jgi:predicted nuclease with TOPRIM domain
MLKSLVLKSVEPTVREWVDAVRRETEELRTEIRREGTQDDAIAARLASMEEESAALKKKLSMAMGAIQAATAQIVQLKAEAEQAQNLAKQAMQRATSAQSTAEAASEGLNEIEAHANGANGVEAPRADGRPEAPRCSVEGCTSKAKTRGMCAKHYKQHVNGTLVT